MRQAEQEYTEADRELQQMGFETLDRLYQSGARLDDVQFVGWLAGLGEWKPTQQKRAA